MRFRHTPTHQAQADPIAWNPALVATQHDATFATECANPIRRKPMSLNANCHNVITACEQKPRPRHAGTIQYATPADPSWRSTPLSDTRPIKESLARLIRGIATPHMPALDLGIHESLHDSLGVRQLPWPQHGCRCYGHRRLRRLAQWPGRDRRRNQTRYTQHHCAQSRPRPPTRSTLTSPPQCCLESLRTRGAHGSGTRPVGYRQQFGSRTTHKACKASGFTR